jgi:amyloid beta precursor protein binding protein 1
MATSDKYDRQLRLWGAKGQRALGETSVVLIRATAAGTETLKNLVLPGVGHFHVLDDVSQISKQEIASNFFLSQTKPESTRAQVACEQLQELNPDAKGTFQHVDDLNEIQDFQQQIFAPLASKKMLVVASDLEPPLLEKVSVACHDAKIPLVVVHSYGLIGIVRLQTPPLALLDPKPTHSPPDLRLVNAFPLLVKLAESIDWSNLEDHQHGHMPYPLILYQVSKEWKQTHDGNLPKSFAEKQEFKAAIKAKSRDFDKELNFQEAVSNDYLAYIERTVDCLDDLAGVDASSTLGVLLKALQKFVDNHHRPPLNGSIPDMTASTDIYVQLQNIYRDQAAEDLEEMKAYITSSSTPFIDIADEDLTSFCANVFAIGRLETRTLEEDYNSPPGDELVEDWTMATFDPYEVPVHTPLVWYLAFRGCQVFYKTHNRYPGVLDDWEMDIPILQECIATVLEHYKLNENDFFLEHLVNDKAMNVAHELTRYANAEIHTVSSVAGGVASQEAVKIITGQYVPLDNTYVFNGIASVGGVYRF